MELHGLIQATPKKVRHERANGERDVNKIEVKQQWQNGKCGQDRLNEGDSTIQREHRDETKTNQWGACRLQ